MYGEEKNLQVMKLKLSKTLLKCNDISWLDAMRHTLCVCKCFIKLINSSS
jgi:hypothetical protein